MKNSMILTAILVLGFSILSCNKSPDFEPGVFNDSEITLTENNLICVRYQENEEEVKFIIEDLLNTSDDREAVFPIKDFLSVSVDINNNNILDERVDTRYGISNGGSNCMQFIISETSSTGCIQEEGYSYDSNFESSSKSSEAHIIYELIINKNNIFSELETVGLIFRLRGEDAGGAIPSIISPLFIETIQFSL